MTEDDSRDSGPHAGLRRASRILVIGRGGSGKSTLALRLGAVLGIEVVHLDRPYWRPVWIVPRPQEWKQTVRRLAGKRAWVMDGDYGGALDLRLDAADAVAFLDLPRSLCPRRVISRRLKYAGRTRPDMTPGCPERVTLQFLRYIWRYLTERRPTTLRRLGERSPGIHTLVLRSRKRFDGSRRLWRHRRRETARIRRVKKEREIKRAAGILLHPTSLPGPYGIGELGPEALRFVDFLGQAGQKLWQILPLGPTDTAGSPYSSYSAFAGNPLLIGTDRLVESGLLKNKPEAVPGGSVDYPFVSARKERLLREAFERARAQARAGAEFEDFREKHGHWLRDYALYAALKGRFGEKPWNRWDEGLARREPRALRLAERELAAEVSYHQFVQYLFYEQWDEIKRAANAAGIEVIGDIPIFVSQDSADVWANQDLFYLDASGEPTVVSGVPPDYFSDTGQLWGNPLYRWDRMREDGYAWWVERITLALTQADAVRIDHFRGFEAYWEIEAGEETAKNGRWVEGPGEDLFGVLRRELGTGGDLPLIAEDLGDITPEVHELRKKIGLPGMKVLQFGFSGPENYFLPHNYDGADYAVYTGTHDNDTTSGWWTSASQDERALVRSYLGTEYVSVWGLIRLAHSSVARRAIVPMQDVLGLGSEARMNTPGTASGNWSWRMEESALTPGLADRLRRLTQTYGR